MKNWSTISRQIQLAYAYTITSLSDYYYMYQY